MVSQVWLLMIKENVQRIHIELLFKRGRRKLMGHYFLSLRLTEAVYHDFLRKVLPELLKDVDLQT
jgi:hypothetical protein